MEDISQCKVRKIQRDMEAYAVWCISVYVSACACSVSVTWEDKGRKVRGRKGRGNDERWDWGHGTEKGAKDWPSQEQARK